MISRETKAIRDSVKHIGEFIGFYSTGEVEIKVGDKNIKYQFVSKDAANEFQSLNLNFRDEIEFLATKRSKIITHYLRHFPSKQISFI